MTEQDSQQVPIGEAMRLATEHHQAGRLPEAEAIYREGPAAHEFPRTVSRLIEMRTHEYMAQPHASGAVAAAEAAAATA